MGGGGIFCFAVGWQALMVLWDDLTKYKMYVTGGVGSRPWDEAIGNRYELPNEHGYAETCAAIGNVMWNWHLENGKELTIHQNTKYPWENTVEVIFENVPAEEFSLFFRVPGWTTSAGVSVNGRFFRSIHKSGHYHEIRRSWEKNDRIEIVFDMPVRVVHAHPHLRENSGCVAIRRGPLIYCVESVDQQNVSVFDIVLPLNLSGISRDFEVMYDPNLLGGIVTITSDVLAYAPVSSDDRLYSFERFPRPLRPVKMIAIPYFAWANRGRSEMKVWIPWTVKQ